MCTQKTTSSRFFSQIKAIFWAYVIVSSYYIPSAHADSFVVVLGNGTEDRSDGILQISSESSSNLVQLPLAPRKLTKSHENVLFFATADGIGRSNSVGGDFVQLVRTDSEPTAVSVGAEYLYWSEHTENENESALFRTPLNDFNQKERLTTVSGLSDIAASVSDSLYIAVRKPGTGRSSEGQLLMLRGDSRESTSQVVLRVNELAVQHNVFEGSSWPVDIEIDDRNGKLYIADAVSGDRYSERVIYEIDLESSKSRVIARYPACTGNRFCTILSTPFVAVNSNSGLLYVQLLHETIGGLYRYDLRAEQSTGVKINEVAGTSGVVLN